MIFLETLNERTLIETSKTLAFRVGERFGDRGLTDAVRNFAAHANFLALEARSLARRNPFLQALLLAVFLSGVTSLIYLFRLAEQVDIFKLELGQRTEFFQALQGVEAGIHITVLTVLAMMFVTSWETRRKRRRALARLHALRCYAHVVDMHQMNKDPAVKVSTLPRTASSPKRDLGSQELLRYLNYCSEMLSLIAKFAALYAQYSKDPVVIAAVNEIELLTSSLSNKIWQKLIILHADIAQAQTMPLITRP